MYSQHTEIYSEFSPRGIFKESHLSSSISTKWKITRICKIIQKSNSIESIVASSFVEEIFENLFIIMFCFFRLIQVGFELGIINSRANGLFNNWDDGTAHTSCTQRSFGFWSYSRRFIKRGEFPGEYINEQIRFRELFLWCIRRLRIKISIGWWWGSSQSEK